MAMLFIYFCLNLAKSIPRYLAQCVNCFQTTKATKIKLILKEKTSQNQFLPILSVTNLSRKFSSWGTFPSWPFAATHIYERFLCDRIAILTTATGPLVIDFQRYTCVLWLCTMMLKSGDTAPLKACEAHIQSPVGLCWTRPKEMIYASSTKKTSDFT